MATRIGLQTFTVRRYLKSPAAIDGAFARLAEIGLAHVELAYVKLQPAYIDALEQAGKCHGISFGSSQIKFAVLDKQRDWMVRLHQQLDCPMTAVSVLPWKAIKGSKNDLLAFTEQLESLGQWYRERGIQLCFHHHDYEFRRYGDQPGIDLILQNTSPETIGLELDTYWVQRGGRNPHEMIRDLGGRVKVVHLRDYSVRPRLIDMQTTDTELGAGNLDLGRIIDACCAQQVNLLAIEQSTRTPYDSVTRSVEHLRQLGYGALLSA